MGKTAFLVKTTKMKTSLPKNRIQYNLRDIVDSRKGKMPSAFSTMQTNSYIPYIDIKLFEKGIVKRFAKNDSKCTLVDVNDVLVVWDGARFGLSSIGQKGALGTTIMALSSKQLLPKFLYYFIQSNFKTIQSKPRGIGIPHIDPNLFWNLKIPLLPISEQTRIVSKIEKLFKEIDDSVSKLQTAQAQIIAFQESFLKKIFSNASSFVKIGDLCNVVRGGSPRPAGDPKYYNGSIPFLKVADLTKDNNKFLLSHTYTIKEAGLRKTRKVEKNTLLLSNSGATLGVPKICIFDTTFNDGIAAFLGLPEESLTFHYYFWLSKTKELRNINQGAAQPNLNTDLIKNILIPNLPLKEQKFTVLEIERQFTVADKMQKAVDIALQDAKKLKQSILKKAFAGELVK